MARRALAWALVTPVAAAGVLVAHALAYRITGTAVGPAHDYLDHAPQVVGIVATVALVGLALEQRSFRPPSERWLALLAPVGFVLQEHFERLVHNGDWPSLLTSPAFVVGLLLQIPVALVCAAVVRRITGTLAHARRPRRPSTGEAWLPLSARPPLTPRFVRARRATGRGPPGLLVP